MIRTIYGEVCGVQQNGYTEYRGIPYAKAPVGERRWQKPQKPEPWEGVFNADTFSCKCAQGAPYGNEFYRNEIYNTRGSEDCLYLNIWVPNIKENKLPVAFWIHGGAFLGGWGSEIEFDGAEYSKRGVILVTINYRVNVYGFLVHPWLSGEGEPKAQGNYGIYDQIEALTWVYENIEAFGGDKSLITVFGQSAGATSVQTLVSTELTGAMISKAIMQSGGSLGAQSMESLDPKQAEEAGAYFVQLTGAASLEELRAKSEEELEQARKELEAWIWKRGQGLMLKPVIDGVLLRDSLNELVRRGLIKDIPYMVGSTELDILVSKEDIAAGKKGALYEGSIRWSLLMESLGRKPSYIYYFKHHLPGDDAGAFHSSDLWYMFGTLGRCWRPMTEVDDALSNKMLDHWTFFMKTGNPNTPGENTWLPCTKENPYVESFI